MFFRRRKQYTYGSSRERYRRERRRMPTAPKRRRRRGLWGLITDFISWFGFLMLVTGAVVGGGLYFLHARFDDAVRTHVEAKFRTAYPKHRVALRAARRLEGQGIELRGLSIAEIGENGVALPLVTVDELFVQCNASIEELLAGRIDAKQLVLRRLKLHAARDAQGQWNLTNLLPLPQFGSQQLPITIENSTVEVLADPADGAVPVTADVRSLALTPVANPDGSEAPRSWQYDGTFAGPQMQQLSVKGNYDLVTKIWTADGNARGCKLSPELAEIIPAEYREQASWLRSLQAIANVRFQATNADAKDWPVRFQLEGDVTGRVEDQRLPFPLSDLKATFKGNDRSLEISNASARVGTAVLNLSCTIGGFREDAPCSLKLTAKQLEVNRQLVGNLPAEWRDLWSMLAPEGIIDAEVALDYDGQRVTQSAVVDCRNVSFAHHKYPYRLTNGEGHVEWRDDELTFDNFRAYAQGREVIIRGNVRRPGPDFDGVITVDVPEPVPVEEKLIAAIPESARNFVQQLNPFGSVTLHAKFERHAGNPPIFDRELTIGIKDGAVNYEKFEYPLSKINGTLTMKNGQWTAQVLKGMNDSATVECNGTWGPDESGVLQVKLTFNAQDVPLADELRDALKPAAQNVWKNIRPRGTLDQLEASVRYDGQTRQTTVELTAQKLPAAGNLKERSITVKPVWLPYQLDDVEGILHCSNGVVELRKLRARGRNSDTLVRLDGVVNTGTDGQWEVRLEPLNVDRVSITHELATALPQRLRNAVTKLNISGPFSIAGGMLLTGQVGETTPTSTQWDLEFDTEDGSVDCGIRVEHLRGGLKLVGGLDNRGLISRGKVQLDSMVYKGILLTEVSGPISIDDEQVGLGEMSLRSVEDGSTRPTPINARVFGGTAQASGAVKLSGDFPFTIEGRLFDGDLSAISREATSRRHQISGRAYADIRLEGNSLGAHTLLGKGNAQLREADIYQLPVVARLLKVVNFSPPNATAFTSSDMVYRIEGDRIYFDEIKFGGQAFSLDGRGEMSLDGALNLVFSTEFGREDFRDVILRPLLKEVGKRVVQVQVTGNLAEPQIEKLIVPEFNEALQTIFPGSQTGNRSNMSRLPKPGEGFERLLPK